MLDVTALRRGLVQVLDALRLLEAFERNFVSVKEMLHGTSKTQILRHIHLKKHAALSDL